MTGHSGYSKYGEDIVCAAVSALAINTVNSIQELTNDVIEVEYKNEGGFLSCILSNSKGNNNSKEALILLRSLELGITSIQKDYKDNIDISYREV